MQLKHQYESETDIPEEYKELYSEKSGKWELTGISGLQTQANVDRLEEALRKEKSDHKIARQSLTAWTQLGDLETVQGNLDRLPELEAASKGKIDEAAIEAMVTRRVEGTIRTRLSPLERQLKEATKERDQLKEANEIFVTDARVRRIHDEVRKAAGPNGEKLVATAVDDALELAEKVFEVTDDDTVVTRDKVGVTPGLKARDWLAEMQPKRPHWWPGTVGAGAGGSGPRGRTLSGPDNPWSEQGWSLTAQGQYLREHGAERAAMAAKAAGVEIGAVRPAKGK